MDEQSGQSCSLRLGCFVWRAGGHAQVAIELHCFAKRELNSGGLHAAFHWHMYLAIALLAICGAEALQAGLSCMLDRHV